ncbi:MAG: GNAT family N-acetyltransferase [Spirochaetota bacterium]
MVQTHSNIRIIKAKLHDAIHIASLIKQLVLETSGRPSINKNYVGKYLKVSGCNILLAKQSGNILGMISYSVRPGLYHAAKSCIIEDFIIVKESRNKGIGGKLLTEVIRKAKQEKCAEISVTTEKTNKAAVRLYKRYGFTDESVYLERHF